MLASEPGISRIPPMVQAITPKILSNSSLGVRQMRQEREHIRVELPVDGHAVEACRIDAYTGMVVCQRQV
jgi:hypothetical protein